MKFLVCILLVVIGLASTTPLDSPVNGLAIEDFDDFLLELGLLSEENVRVDDVETKLKDRFEYILEKIKEALDDGKAVKEDLLTKLKEIKAKLKSKIGDKAKALMHKIRESGRNYLKNFLKGLGLSKRAIEERSQGVILKADEKSLEEVQKELKERLDEVLNKIKDAIDQGKSVKEDMLKKMKDLRQKMKDMNLELGNKSKAILDKIKDKGRDFLKDILKKLGFKSDALLLLAENQRSADIDIFGMIDQLKDLIKEKFNPEKLKAIVEKYLGKGSGAAEELIKALKEKGEKRKQKILEWIERIFQENQE